MKKGFFCYGAVLSLLLYGCGGNDDQGPEQEVAVFRISYTQQGDLEGFTRLLTYDTNLASDEDFIWSDTQKPAPAYLNTDSLTERHYVIETKMPVKEMSINLTLGWIPTRAWEDGWHGPDEIALALTVWKDDELIDTETIRLTSEDEPSSKSFQKSYDAQP